MLEKYYIELLCKLLKATLDRRDDNSRDLLNGYTVEISDISKNTIFFLSNGCNMLRVFYVDFKKEEEIEFIYVFRRDELHITSSTQIPYMTERTKFDSVRITSFVNTTCIRYYDYFKLNIDYTQAKIQYKIFQDLYKHIQNGR
jgi:hypothetical protein